MMLSDVDRFLSASDYTPATASGYAYHLKRLAEWLDALNVPPDALTAAMLKIYLNSHGWKSNTQRQAGSAAKSFLKWRYGALHPALTLKLPKDDAAPGRTLNETEVDRLLAIFDTTKPIGWRNLAMFAIMLETGLRVSEICRLELDYLNLEGRHLYVMAKGRVWREGVFSAVTASYLDIWLNARKEYAHKTCPYVFVSVNGKTKGHRMTPGGLRANFRRMAVRAELKDGLSPHDLRRTMATLLTEAGAPTRLVQELGAWADIDMVVRYTRRLKPQQIDRFSPLTKPHHSLSG